MTSTRMIGINTSSLLSRYLAIFFSFLVCKGIENAGFTCNYVDTKADAKAISDSKLDPQTIAKILPFRTEEECIAINGEVATFNGGKNLTAADYLPLQNTTPYQDLLFALVNESETVLSKYLGQYLYIKDETFIIMIYIQIEERQGFRFTYDKQHPDCDLDCARRNQRHPFANALKVWAEYNRCLFESTTPPFDDSCTQGQSLRNERKHWNEKRTDLERMLMQHRTDYAHRGIDCYNAQGSNLIDDINHHIDNHDLKDLYISLVTYIQSECDYLAQKLLDYSDGRDNWAFWIIMLTTRRGERLNPIDEAFKKIGKKISLKEHLETCNITDKIFKNMLKDLADRESTSQRQKPAPAPEAHPSLPLVPQTIIAPGFDADETLHPNHSAPM